MRHGLRSRTLSLAVFLVTGAACGSPGGGAYGVSIRDSAGVEIVEITGPSWSDGEGWRLSERSALQIGVLEGPPEYQLYQVADALRLSDGRLAVANAGSSEIRFYGADGSHLRSAGGAGEGPGEFRALTALFRTPEDSVLAFDQRLRRVSVFSGDGDYAHSFLLEAGAAHAFPALAGLFSDGSLLVTGPGQTDSEKRFEPGLNREPLYYLRYDREGRLADTIAVVPGAETYVGEAGGRGFLLSRPFGRQPRHAVRGDAIFLSASDTFEIRRYSAGGALRASIRRWQGNPAVTSADVADYVRRSLEEVQGAENRRLFRLVLDLPYPSRKPAVRALAVDPLGHLWAARFAAAGAETEPWDVFSPEAEGVLLGTVSTPAGLRVLEIGADYVLGVARDDLGVEVLRLYSLIREQASPTGSASATSVP